MQVVDLGSMTRAAERLNVAQPALGLQMRQLEQELGVPLLQRHSRGVVPTEAGRLLHERGTEILALVERTVRELGALAPGAVTAVTLGLTPSLMRLVAADLLVRAREQAPGLALHLVEELSFVLLDMLRRRDLDVALAYDVPAQPGLARVPWMTEELLFVTAPGDPGATGPATPQGIVGTIPLAEALRRDLALAGPRDGVRRVVEAAAASLSLTPRVVFEVQSVQAMLILAADGLAASILPYGSVVAELLAGRLVGRRITGARLERTLFLVHGGAALPDRDPALPGLFDRVRQRLFERLGPLARTVPL